MSNSNIPVPNAEYRLEELDNELLLYHPSKTKTVYLNETASLVWQLCDGNRSIAEISLLLSESFPESETDIVADVEKTIAAFIDHGAVELISQS